MPSAVVDEMKLKDARTIAPDQLYERRKQAVALFKKGRT